MIILVRFECKLGLVFIGDFCGYFGNMAEEEMAKVMGNENVRLEVWQITIVKGDVQYRKGEYKATGAGRLT